MMLMLRIMKSDETDAKRHLRLAVRACVCVGVCAVQTEIFLLPPFLFPLPPPHLLCLLARRRNRPAREDGESSDESGHQLCRCFPCAGSLSQKMSASITTSRNILSSKGYPHTLDLNYRSICRRVKLPLNPKKVSA